AARTDRVFVVVKQQRGCVSSGEYRLEHSRVGGDKTSERQTRATDPQRLNECAARNRHLTLPTLFVAGAPRGPRSVQSQVFVLRWHSVLSHSTPSRRLPLLSAFRPSCRSRSVRGSFPSGESRGRRRRPARGTRPGRFSTAA